MDRKLIKAELDAVQMADFIARGFNPSSRLFYYDADVEPPEKYYSAKGDLFTPEEVKKIRSLFEPEAIIFIPNQSDTDE